MKTIAILKEYTRIFDESKNLLTSVVNLQDPDLTSLDVPEQGVDDSQRGVLYREIEKIQWADLLDEMNYNAEPYTFSSYWAHYKRQFDFLFSKFDWKDFRDNNYDLMYEGEGDSIFKFYF